MILTCPACATRFAVEASALGPSGRRVRCGNCKHVWHQTPPEIEDEPFPKLYGEPAEDRSPPPAVAAEDAPPRRSRPMRPPPAPPPRRRGAAFAWTFLILLVAAVGGGGWFLRTEIVEAWPNARRLYDMAGIRLEPLGAGLELRKVTWKRAEQDGVSVLLVEGEVANVSKVVRDVPKIRGALVGGGKEVQHWVFAPGQAKLLPGESVAFRTELRNPAAGAERLTMNFLAEP
jgi:predicted Zn finger-like uncharacterized protein